MSPHQRTPELRPRAGRDPQPVLRRRLQWLMFFRVVVASFFLGIAAVTQLQKTESFFTQHLVGLYVLTGSVYVLTIVYVVLLPFLRWLREFALGQIFIDQLLITALLYITGGVHSIFPFMYSVSIIAGGILLYVFGGVLTASIASLLYGAVVLGQYYGLVSPPVAGVFIAGGYAGEAVYFPLTVNISAFYLIAFLSSFVAEQARKTRQQLQKKESDLEELEALHRDIIQSINSGLITLDSDRRVILFNQAARSMTGLGLAEVYGRRIEELLPGFEVAIARQESQGSSLPEPRFEMSYTRTDGRVLCLGFSISVLRDADGEETGTILGFQDLTSLKEMQDYISRMDRLAAVGRLAAGIAHEIRNPLASISGSIQMLRKSLQPVDTDRRLMDIIVRESENLSQLISDFTQFVKPGRPEREQVMLRSAVAEVVDLFGNSPDGNSGIDIEVDISESLTVQANRSQLHQVLWNLVLNAAQAIPERGRISISAGPRPPETPLPGLGQNGCWVELRVRDTGTGIPSDAMDKIFDPFFTTRDRGTGLGLSIVHKIVQEHRGSISVASTPGAGSTFSLCLPCAPVDAA